jgi:hypothetical protein
MAATAQPAAKKNMPRMIARKRARTTAALSLQAEHDRLQNRVHAMYVDELDGRIDKHFFEKLSAEWRSEQARRVREITLHQAADPRGRRATPGPCA